MTSLLRFATYLGATLLFACGHAPVNSGALRVYTFEHDSANAHLVIGEHGSLLIDAGYAHNAARLADDMREVGFDPARLRAVILTHGHADHAGGARYFQRHYKVPVLAGRGDAPMLHAGKNEPLCPTGLLGRVRWRRDQAAHYDSTVADVPVAAPLSLRELTGIDGEVVPLPGHTRGSLVVVLGQSAFVGDLFRGTLIGSGAAAHLYMCDRADNERDARELLQSIAPRASRFFAGHFGPVARQEVERLFSAR